MDLKEMLERKLKWKTLDDVSEILTTRENTPFNVNGDKNLINLKPQ
jgi:hypothetical protein